MKKLILSSLGVLALVLVFSFQSPEVLKTAELVIEMPDVQKELKTIPTKDYKANQDGVMDFDDK